MFISNGLTSPKWSPAWPTPRLKLSRVQVHRVTIFSIWLKMGLCADTGYVQSVSFSIIYFTSILLKSGVIFFGIALISDGVLSWVSWLNLFMENIDLCLLKSSMRSGDMARICRVRLSIGNLQGRTPWVWLVRVQPWPHSTLEEKNGASFQCARIH